jgi:hypothetical protein
MKPNRIQVFRDFLATPTLALVDSPEALGFLVSQLAYIETTVYEKMRAPLDYQRLVPISTAAGEWAKAITFRMRDFAGRGRRHALKGRDLPRVDVFYAEESWPVHGGALAYGFTFEELRTSGRLGLPLDTDRADAAFEAYNRHMNMVGLYGEEDLTGVFNNPHVPVMPATYGNWLATPRPDDLASRVLVDINNAIIQVWTQSKRNAIVDTIALPGRQFGLLASTPAGNSTDTTILTWLLANNLSRVERNQQINIIGGADLEEAGTAGVSRMILYERAERNVVMHIPMPILFHTPQVLGLETQVPAEYKYSGVEWRYPLSAVYVDGI